MKKEDVLVINQRQKEFYNKKNKNFVTKIWSKLRHGLLANIRKEIGISNQVYKLHKDWMGDLSNKKVLDLGCFAGNSLSVYLAEHAKQYVGLDLSEVGIQQLNEKIKHVATAQAIASDFLNDSQFDETNFDVIYAYGVLHHFKDTKMIIDRLKEKLVTNGIVITYDPLETSLPVKMFRTIYRPFQSDKEWEWPFTKKTYNWYKNEFTIVDQHGVLGKTKWFFLVHLLPISKNAKLEKGIKWHQQDWKKSQYSENYLLSCMHLTMKLQKK